jgi:pyridoxal phosphate enzyme (YggS family)
MVDPIAENIRRVRERIAQAARRSGRAEESVTLIAVTKTIAVARIAAAYAEGIRDFGENYVQEARAKIGTPPLDKDDLRWHFIGHLQTNKARDVLGRFALLHSVDSLALATALDKRAQATGQSADILLEVKLDPSATKFGFAPEATLEAAAQICALPGLRLCGLMGMAPFTADPEAARPAFRQLHSLFRQLPAAAQQSLSMGMTGDFEVAIEEGATHVRIGTAIFGPRSG